MKVYVNGKKFKIYEHDTFETFIERLAASMDAIPSFLHLDKTGLKPNEKYLVTDIREVLKDLSVDKFIEDIPIVSEKFPRMTFKDLGLVWVYVNGVPEDIKSLKKLNREAFKNRKTSGQESERYMRSVKEKIRLLKEKSEAHLNIYKALKKIDSSSDLIGDFVVKEVSTETMLHLPNGELLIDIFDQIVSSKFVPYAMLKTRTKTFYKIYSNIIPPIKWLDLVVSGKQNYLLIKVLKIPEDSFVKDVDDSYANIIWESFAGTTKGTKIHRLNLEVSLQSEIKEEGILKNLFQSLPALKYQITDRIEKAVKGEFSVNVPLDKIVFADLITNDPLISLMFFFNEAGDKSLMQKKRFHAFYYPQEPKEPDKALSFNVIDNISGTKFDISITRSKTIDQITNFKRVFAKFLSIYQEQKDDISNLYTSIIGQVKSKKKTQIKKTRKRVDALRSFNKDLFPSPFFARLCQKHKQPYVLESNKVANFVKEHGENKIVEFPMSYIDGRFVGSGIYYACEPREPTDKDGLIFAGVLENTVTTTKQKNDTEEMKKKMSTYEEKFPYIPCCFKTPSENKYANYLTWLETGIKTLTSKKSSYVKTIRDKAVSADQNAYLPEDIKLLFSYEGDVDKTIRRIGMINSPNSFLHCMEKAFNPEYKGIPVEKRERFIQKVRSKLVDEYSDVLSVVKQETYDMTLSEVETYINDTNTYFDPDMFVKLMEYVYGCNIFIYQVTPKKSKGEVVIPRHTEGYYYWNKDPMKPSVVIIKYAIPNFKWPFQCELVFDLRKKATFVIKDAKFNEVNIRAFKMALEQYKINSKTIEKIKDQSISPLIKKASFQVIDLNGKIFGMGFGKGGNKITIITSPGAPLALSMQTSINSVNTKLALNFIETNSLQIKGLSEDKKGLFIQLDGFEEAYIPLETSLEDKNIPIIKSDLYIPIEEQESKLQIFQKNRKIAQYLKEYAVFLYVQKDFKLIKKNFIIDPDYTYDLDRLDKTLSINNSVMFKNGKLVVNSKDIRDKLINYTGIVAYNSPDLENRYKEGAIIENYYSTTSDFISRRNQLVFLGVEPIVQWIEFASNEAQNTITNEFDYDFREGPYFYRNYKLMGEKIVIIQNVYEGDLARAVYVAKVWKEKGVNMGFWVPKSQTDNDNISIITPTGIERRGEGQYTILAYPDNKFAAVLELKKM